MKTVNKRIAELQAAVDALKQEEAALKERLQAAERELYEAQREVKRNTKPTPAMLATLKLMAQGEPIYRSRYSYSFYTHDAEGRTVKVRESVFDGLTERDALSRPNTSKDEWFINDHGRAILARWAK